MAREPDPSPEPNQGTALWAWNGTEWEPILADYTGRVQIERMSTVADELIKIRGLLESMFILMQDMNT